MQISVRAQITDVIQTLDDIHKRHVPFAAIYAATLTAKEVKVQEISTMRRVFDRPTPYILNSLSMVPASKSRPFATVETDLRDPGKGTPAKRVLLPHIKGGSRHQKRSEQRLQALLGTSYLVPSRSLPTDAYGNVPGSTYMKILSRLGTSTDPYQNASQSRRSKGKRQSEAFFKLKGKPIIMQRKGAMISPALIGIRAPQYKARFPFFEVAVATVEREFPRQFVVALERAIARGHFKNKRGTTWASMGYGVNR